MSKLIFNKPIEHISKPTEYQLSASELSTRLCPLDLKNTYIWDYTYWYVSLEDWGKVLKDVVFGMPKYTTDKFDCENFAMLVSARVSERYQLNTCGVAIGQSPFGEHGFNLLVTETDMIYFEPQTGDYIPVTDGGYKAHTVLFGG